MKLFTIVSVVLLTIISNIIPATGFSNFFNQILQGLANEKIDKNTIKAQFNLNKPKCAYGSYFFNGSCYFVSNHRFINTDSLLSSILSLQLQHNSQFVDSIESTNINANVLTNILPLEAKWNESKIYCEKLNNASSLIYFDNENEYEFLINLLFKLKFRNNETDFLKEESFFIGLFYDVKHKTWTLLNNAHLNESVLYAYNKSSKFIPELKLLKETYIDYLYKPCGYISLRDNGKIRVDMANCNKDVKPYICKYVLDRCFNNSACGQNGECINLIFKKTFECRCRILYDGKYCEKWSQKGVQMLVCAGLVFFIVIATITAKCTHFFYRIYFQTKNFRIGQYRKNFGNSAMNPLLSQQNLASINSLSVNIYKTFLNYIKTNFKLLVVIVIGTLLALTFLLIETCIRFEVSKKYKLSLVLPKHNNTQRSMNFTKLIADSKWSADMCRLVQDTFVEDYIFVTFSLPLTVFIYVYNSFCFSSSNHTYKCRKNNSIKIDDNDHAVSEHTNVLRNFCSLLKNCYDKIRVKRRSEKPCRLEFISPMNPFSKRKRFITAVIYAAYTYNILKIFEYLLIGDQFIENIDETGNKIKESAKKILNTIQSGTVTEALSNLSSNIERGILTDLLKQIFNVIIIGLRYYPILLCVEMKRKRALCYFLCSIYMWCLFVFYFYTNTFCLLFKLNMAQLEIWTNRLLKSDNKTVITSSVANMTSDFVNKNKFIAYLNYTINENDEFLANIMYEKLIFYIVLCFILIHLTVETIFLLLKKFKNNYCSNSTIENKPVEPYHSSEYLYTKRLLNKKQKSKSFIKYLFEKYIYKFRAHFKYSKQLINTYVIAFILLFYITCIIIRKSKFIINLISELLIMFISFLFKIGASDSSNSIMFQSKTRIYISYLFTNINYDIILSCCIATTIYVIQLLLGMRNYQKHVLKAYRGVYNEIPSPKRFTNTKKASSSLHYSGYMIGYLLWGYMILFEVLIVLIVLFRFLLKFYFIIEKLGKYLLPILVIYLFKRLLIWYLTRYFLIKKANNTKFFFLKNFKLYYVLSHFNFFFDCFLGSFVCFMRMAQSCLAAIFFMPRLDYSIYGRSLEHIDMGFISYVNFVHMDVNQTHPIKIAFCELLMNLIKQKRQNNTDDDDDDDCDALTRKRRLCARNRWFVAVMIIQMRNLSKQRKGYLRKHARVPKVESFEQFLERQVKSISSNTYTKIISHSIQSLDRLTDADTLYSLNSKFNTISSMSGKRSLMLPSKKALQTDV